MGICHNKVADYVETRIVDYKKGSRSNLGSITRSQSKSISAQGEIQNLSKLLDAIKIGDLILVRKFINEGISVNVFFEKYSTPLIIACKHRQERVALFLIENGADVNSTDVYGRTPILFSTLFNLNPVVKELLKLNAEINIVETMVRPPSLNMPLLLTPFSACIINENIEMMQLLKDHALKTTPDSYISYLSLCVKYSTFDILQFLLSFGIPFDNEELGDQSPVIVALKESKEEMALAMLKLCHNFKIQSSAKESLLLLIVKFNFTNLFNFILDKCIDDVHTPDVNLFYPIMYSVMNNNIYMTRRLIEYGARLNTLNYEGKCAYDYGSNDMKPILTNIYENQKTLYPEAVPIRIVSMDDKKTVKSNKTKGDGKSILKKQSFY